MGVFILLLPKMSMNSVSETKLLRSLARNQAHTPLCLSFEFLEYSDKTSNSDLQEVHIFRSDLFFPNKVVLDDSTNLLTPKFAHLLLRFCCSSTKI